MRTVTFKSVFDAVVRRCGLDETASDLSASRQEYFADLINLRVKRGWEYAFWPELCVCEERTWRAAWSATTAYAAGEDVYNAQDAKYYISTVATTNERPDLFPAVWTVLTSYDKYLPYDPADATALGEVLWVGNKNPEKYGTATGSGVKSWAFTPGASGVWVTESGAGATVWVKYRRRPGKFTRVAWSAGGSYTVGSLVYVAAEEECFQAALVDGAEVWNKIDFPYLLEAYVIYGATADYYRHAGQRERADTEEAQAAEALETAYMRIFNQQGQARTAAIGVY